MVQCDLAAPSLPEKIGSDFCLEMEGHVGGSARRISGRRGFVHNHRVQPRDRRTLWAARGKPYRGRDRGFERTA
jgi:hypothetical protein